MAKFVRYNGGTESCYGSTDPRGRLVEGEMYEVIDINDRGFHTDYTLKGVKGKFNSCWFDDVATYKAFTSAYNIPRIGKSYHCYKLEKNDKGEILVIPWTTSLVKEFQKIGDMYMVTTLNSIYVVLTV